jgi:Arc/MetJ-type ribon-helix-helix transcriptional regulator
MSTQITVRLPDSMVAQLDALIAQGQASSRASVVEAALRRELRAHLHAQEAELMAQAEPDSDLESVVDWVAINRPGLH